MAGLSACENQELEWEDFEIKAVYFPFQTPIRTLSLGEDRIDNSLDKKLMFDIGVTIGGMYENNQEWTVDYVLDNSLLEDSVFGSGKVPLIQLPSSYYTLNPTNTIIIPNGSFSGRVRVELSDQFLEDTLALTGQYVIPLRITNTSADSILTGTPAVANPDRRIVGNWVSRESPKDWVLFGIKYINAYEGTYLQRGRVIAYSGINPVDTIVYHAIHVERDKVVSLKTINKTKTVTNFIGHQSSETGEYAMELEFANMWGTPGGQVNIRPRNGALYAVTGTGQYFDKANSDESWIGLTWQSMHLSYSYDDAEYTYEVTDTLVFRDRDLRMEQHSLSIIKEE